MWLTLCMSDLLLILLNKLINNTILNNHMDNNRYNVLEKEIAKKFKHQNAGAMIKKQSILIIIKSSKQQKLVGYIKIIL